MNTFEILKYASPALGAVALMLGLYSWRMSVKMRNSEVYEQDDYRQAIEREIANLSRQLGATQERFMKMNHLLLESPSNHSYSPDTIPSPNRFVSELGVNLATPVDDELIFVLAPFNEEFSDQYWTIKKTAEEMGFRCKRGDEDYKSRNILQHVVSEALRARLVIANISGRNPNVFYELGIVQALGKPVLIVSDVDQPLAFDVSSTRVLMFQSTHELRDRLSQWITHSLARSG